MTIPRPTQAFLTDLGNERSRARSSESRLAGQLHDGANELLTANPVDARLGVST